MRFVALLIVAVLVPAMFIPAAAQEDGQEARGAVQAVAAQAAQEDLDLPQATGTQEQEVVAQPVPPPAPTAQQLPPVATGTTVWLYAGNPFTTGDLIATGAVTDLAIAETSAATFADVRVCGQGHVFAVATVAAAGAPVGTTMLTVRGGTLALSDVAAQLEQACAAGRLKDAQEALGANRVFTTSASAAAEPAAAGPHVFFVVSAESGRHTAAVTRLNELAAAELSALSGVSHLRLQSGIYGYVFAIAQLPQTGQAIGETLVQVNNGTMPLAQVSARIEAAIRGDEQLVLFAQGATSDDVIVGLVSPGSVSLNDSVPFSGATIARVWMNGHSQSYAVTSTGPTLATILVCPAAEAGCPSTSGLFTQIVPGGSGGSTQ